MLRVIRLRLNRRDNTLQAMKLAPVAFVLASLVHSNAWSSLPTLQHRRAVNFHTTTVAASIVPDEIISITSFVRPEQGNTVAEGPIVSSFAGGLVAVLLDDDVKTSSSSVALTDANGAQRGDDLVGRLARFQCGSLGLVLCQRPPMAFVYCDSLDYDAIDGKVQITDLMAQIDVGDEMRVVNCFGKPSPFTNIGIRPVFAPIPKVSDISLINAPMLTGNTMIDVLAPIGKGQNMLLIGSSIEELRDLALTTFRTQSKESNVKCVYAATKDPQAIMSKFTDVLDDVVVVAARDGIDSEAAQAAEAIVVAGTACAVAEAYALEKGMDTIVVVDSLDLHKSFWDMTTRVLVDVYGVDAVVAADREGGASSEMRAFYSSLLQRAANFRKDGAGSFTLVMMVTVPESQDDEGALFSQDDFAQAGDKVKARIDLLVQKGIPITAATLRKIQIPIPSVSEGKRRLVLQHIDDLISMSDGQIWFDETLRAGGQSPPIDPQRSITRIGIGADTESRADAPAIRRIAEGVRLDLAQAANMDGAETTAASSKQMRKFMAWHLAMHQIPGSNRSLSESCVLLLAASIGVLDKTIESGITAGSEKGQTLTKELLEHVKTRVPNVLNSIDESFDISDEGRSALDEAIRSYF